MNPGSTKIANTTNFLEHMTSIDIEELLETEVSVHIK
jgi:hypothetical protein